MDRGSKGTRAVHGVRSAIGAVQRDAYRESMVRQTLGPYHKQQKSPPRSDEGNIMLLVAPSRFYDGCVFPPIVTTKVLCSLGPGCASPLHPLTNGPNVPPPTSFLPHLMRCINGSFNIRTYSSRAEVRTQEGDREKLPYIGLNGSMTNRGQECRT
eukprot:4564492-Prymnesium_polylepis.2